jgi:hypothetical protein
VSEDPIDYEYRDAEYKYDPNHQPLNPNKQYDATEFSVTSRLQNT